MVGSNSLGSMSATSLNAVRTTLPTTGEVETLENHERLKCEEGCAAQHTAVDLARFCDSYRITCSPYFPASHAVGVALCDG